MRKILLFSIVTLLFITAGSVMARPPSGANGESNSSDLLFVSKNLPPFDPDLDEWSVLWPDAFGKLTYQQVGTSFVGHLTLHGLDPESFYYLVLEDRFVADPDGNPGGLFAGAPGPSVWTTNGDTKGGYWTGGGEFPDAFPGSTSTFFDVPPVEPSNFVTRYTWVNGDFGILIDPNAGGNATVNYNFGFPVDVYGGILPEIKMFTPPGDFASVLFADGTLDFEIEAPLAPGRHSSTATTWGGLKK